MWVFYYLATGNLQPGIIGCTDWWARNIVKINAQLIKSIGRSLRAMDEGNIPNYGIWRGRDILAILREKQREHGKCAYTKQQKHSAGYYGDIQVSAPGTCRW